jgi:hypothetical protein
MGLSELWNGSVYDAHLNLRTATEIVVHAHRMTPVMCYCCCKDPIKMSQGVAADKLWLYENCPISSYVGYVDSHIEPIIADIKTQYHSWFRLYS